MTRTVNEKGDLYQPTKTMHGIDISSQRTDWLDQCCLDAVSEKAAPGQDVITLDLGAGEGAQSIRMARTGAKVTAVDLETAALSQNVSASGPQMKQRIRVIEKRFEHLQSGDLPEDMDFIYAQRSIHYLPYDGALTLLKMARNKMARGGQIFISAGGFDTEYGLAHPGRDKPIQDRFDFISPEMQKKHGICHKITVYTAGEMAELLSESGFSVQEVRLSEFGNVKAIGKTKG